MLTRFEVTGFKNFKDTIVLDFTNIRDYQFNTHCVRDQLLNKIIVYGKNGTGKSNLGLALFDITTHLTENGVAPSVYDYYLNTDRDTSHAEFRYSFRFGQTNITYVYRKSDTRKLLYEEVIVDANLVFKYDFTNNDTDLSGLAAYAPTLNLDFKETNLSLLRYVITNSKEADVKPLALLMHFVSNMLWYRSLDKNSYIGYKPNTSDFFRFIFEGDNLNEFEEFLHKAGIGENLRSITDPSGNLALYFDKKIPLPFFQVASNGTKALYVIFYWLKTCVNLSLLFIDEFDAYYHTELSETIVEMLEEQQNFQTILTSHNTNLMTNRIMRPDCYFILTPDRLVSFANATTRELREGHNLEKLYLSGEFDE